MRFRIEITDRARDDADAAYDGMAANISEAHAQKWYQGLFEDIETLARLASRCPIAAESKKYDLQIRELIHGKTQHKYKYWILFVINDDLVSILSVHHSSRAEFEP
jgi:plasmid stabilization system protein ParE